MGEDPILTHLLHIKLVFKESLECGADFRANGQGLEVFDDAVVHILLHKVLIKGKFVESDQLPVVIQIVEGECELCVVLFSSDCAIFDFADSLAVQHAVIILGELEVKLCDSVESGTQKGKVLLQIIVHVPYPHDWMPH